MPPSARERLRGPSDGLGFLGTTQWQLGSALLLVSFLLVLNADKLHPLLNSLPGWAVATPRILLGFVLLFVAEAGVKLWLRGLASPQALIILYQEGLTARTSTDWLFVLDCALVWALLVVSLAQPLHGVGLRTAFASLLVLPRFLLVLIHRAIASWTPRTLEREQFVALVWCRGVPLRVFVELLAFLIACAGGLLLTTGGMTYLELQSITFLHPAFPTPTLAGRSVALAGLLMLLIGLGAWTAVFFSQGSRTTLAVMLSAGLCVLLTGFYAVESADATLSLNAASALGRQALFSEVVLDALPEGRALLAAERAAVLSHWAVERERFDSVWQRCRGVVYNSTRVDHACRIATRAPRDAAGASGGGAAQAGGAGDAGAWTGAGASGDAPLSELSGQAAAASAASAASAAAAGASGASGLEAEAVRVRRWAESLWSLAVTRTSEALAFARESTVGGVLEALGRAAASLPIGWRERLPPSLRAMNRTDHANADEDADSGDECPELGSPERYLLYCDGAYLSKYHVASALHDGGRSAGSVLGRFDVLVSRYCLHQPADELRRIMRSPAYINCTRSPQRPHPASSPRSAPRDSSAASPLDSSARRVFTALATPDLALDSTAGFCLCQNSEAYVELLQWYRGTLQWYQQFTQGPLLVLGVLPLLLSLYMCCPCCCKLQDTSRYFDKDLL